MTDKQRYWIRDVDGVYAQVEGAEARDQWTKVHGWTEADEPGPTDQVHVVNEHPEVGPGRLPFGAIDGPWDALGWQPGPPPGAEVPAPAAERAAEPKSPPSPKSASSGEKIKE